MPAFSRMSERNGWIFAYTKCISWQVSWTKAAFKVRSNHFPVATDLANVGVFLGGRVGGDGDKGIQVHRKGCEISPRFAHQRFTAKVVELENKFSVVMCRL